MCARRSVPALFRAHTFYPDPRPQLFFIPEKYRIHKPLLFVQIKSAIPNIVQQYGDFSDMPIPLGVISAVLPKGGFKFQVQQYVHPHLIADLVDQEIIRLLRSYMSQVKNITYDNGTKFPRRATINSALGCMSYFAKPYYSWERGANENMNGLIRQYFSKNEKIGNGNSDKISLVQNSLNERPRKVLGWKTPNEVFLEQGFSVTAPTVALGT